jgi:hypothetical protein
LYLFGYGLVFKKLKRQNSSTELEPLKSTLNLPYDSIGHISPHAFDLEL